MVNASIVKNAIVVKRYRKTEITVLWPCLALLDFKSLINIFSSYDHKVSNIHMKLILTKFGKASNLVQGGWSCYRIS